MNYTITVTENSEGPDVPEITILSMTGSNKPNLEEIFRVFTGPAKKRHRRTKAEIEAARSTGVTPA